ncbi:hypothetical protein NQZ68_015957 [Dissostichus eleginoides]|nr:hypothetical protein NQZ68_015957 [Dissostichus eleginoides]
MQTDVTICIWLERVTVEEGKRRGHRNAKEMETLESPPTALTPQKQGNNKVLQSPPSTGDAALCFRILAEYCSPFCLINQSACLL